MTAAALSVAQAPIRAPAATASVTRAQTAAKEFEGVFISQMLGQMFSGIETDQTFGGGQGETMFRSLMIDQYGKQISAQGGIGLASNITAQLLKHQEVALKDQQTQAAEVPSTPATPPAAAQERAP
jgi:Rod binding domain-containing protein